MTTVIKIINLSFNYDGQSILQNVSLDIPQGSCFGLLGQNGAGKSTLMKLLLGLLKPHQGKIFIQGQEFRTAATELFQNIGSLIESPPLYPHLSAKDNLMLTVLYRDLHPRRISEVLAAVGLSTKSHQKVSTFSTGMKQRLGIAAALLPEPELLILDEPLNGLDPESIVAVRKLIQRLHQHEGKTILMSSHLLHEIEQCCDHVGILREGKLLLQANLQSLYQKQFAQQAVWVETNQKETTLQLIRQSSFQADMEHENVLVKIQRKEDIPVLIDLLRGHGISIYQIRLAEQRLENIYLHFTEAENLFHE